ncbi:hypothetical protein U0070_004011 [Myodes glareolus]|uniref:Uncharacterized protein n=1 Tax=Myodes glareolus TaxID=447135 RepID=A0AAW0KB32_MYOGA
MCTERLPAAAALEMRLRLGESPEAQQEWWSAICRDYLTNGNHRRNQNHCSPERIKQKALLLSEMVR